jgi:hypothetical protein
MHRFLILCLAASALASSASAADREFLLQPKWRTYHVWETTLDVTVPRIAGPPTIDGKLDDACWTLRRAPRPPIRRHAKRPHADLR